MKVYKFINYINKYKLILGIIIIIFGLFLSYSPIIEGLTGNIGEYEFLAPSTDNISDEMWNKLSKKYSKFEFRTVTAEQLKSAFIYNITNKEINYYLENGEFPVSSYIKKTFITFFLKQQKKSKEEDPSLKMQSKSEIESSVKGFTSRYIYGMFLASIDKEKNPQPDAYLIYMGIKTPPSYAIYHTHSVEYNKKTLERDSRNLHTHSLQTYSSLQTPLHTHFPPSHSPSHLSQDPPRVKINCVK